MTRHNDNHKNWQPSPHTCDAFRSFSGWTVVVCELLHSKVPGIRDINYIHDILVYNSEHLIDKTFIERQELLSSLFPNASSPASSDLFGHGYRVIDDHTWLAVNYATGTDFLKLFKGLKSPIDEGLVLKKTDAKLVYGSSATSNSGWQLKIRKQTKRISF